jgi:hypothetical protein
MADAPNLQNPTFGKIKTKTADTVTEVDLLATVESDGTIAKISPSLLGINVYVTPEQYGAIGDGTTNDNTAVQNAINTGKAVILSKTYLVTDLEIPANASLQGLGTGILKTTSNNYVLEILTQDVTISGLTFLGSGRDTGLTNQNALEITGMGADNTIVSDCRFFNFGGSAFLNEGNGNRQSGSTVSNSFIHNCNYGIRLFNEGEYNSFVGVSVEDCNFGFHNSAGNNTFTGGRLIENGTNVYLGTGVNDGHGVVSATTINHGVNYNVYSDGVVNNFLFDGCMLYLGNVSINNSNGIRFNACEFSLIGFTLTLNTNSNTIFESSKFATWGSYSLTGTEALWHDNTFPNQQPPSSIINRMTGSNISYIQNLGLGTITPDIFTRSYDKILGVYGSGTAGIEINGNSNHANLDLGTSGVRRFNINVDGSSNSIVSITNPIYFNVNSGIRAAINPNGNVLIGTLSDDTVNKLQVDGGVRVASLAGTGTRQVVADASGNLSSTDLAPTSGTYTPTFSAGVNVTLLAGGANYFTIGDLVTVYLKISLNITASSTASSFKINLPVNRTTSNPVLPIGSGSIGGGVIVPVKASLDTANNTGLIVNFVAGAGSGSVEGNVSFQYRTTD